MDPSELAEMREQALARKRVQDSARAWVGKIRGYHRSQMRMRQYEQIELEMFKYGFSVRDRHSLPCTIGCPKLDVLRVCSRRIADQSTHPVVVVCLSFLLIIVVFLLF